MIRLTMLQFRVQAAVALGCLAAIALVLVITGPHIAHLYDVDVVHCHAPTNCVDTKNGVAQLDTFLQHALGFLLPIVPALIGAFWGAPLVARELENGTFRLAWTQSVSRRRWLVSKLVVLGIVSVVVAGLLSLMTTWWFHPIDTINADRFAPEQFAARDIVVMGYAAFAFALGAAVGAAIRRTIPAMAATLVAFTAVRTAFTHWLRPHLMPAVHGHFALDSTTVTGFGSHVSGTATSALNLFSGPPNLPNAWFYSTKIVDASDHPLTTSYLRRVCGALFTMGGPDGSSGQTTTSGGPLSHSAQQAAPVHIPGGTDPLHTCTATLAPHFHELAIYQPASRYWTFQAFETAIYLGFALALATACYWWVRKKIT